MTKMTNVHLELSDLSPSDLAKVVDLIDTLGPNLVTYSIQTGDPKPPKPVYRKFDKGDTPYAVEKTENDILEPEPVETKIVQLDIEPSTTNIPLMSDVENHDSDLKKNIKKFL